MEVGNEVGDLAMGYFGEYTDVTVCDGTGNIDLAAMIAETERLLRNGAETVCEASFDFNGLYCAVDILHKEGDGYAIYEVKSSTDVKDRYITDAAYQKYVLQKCGVNVVGTHIMTVNKHYVKRGAIDLQKLFNIDDGDRIAERIAERSAEVEGTLAEAERVMSCNVEPPVAISERCGKPNECDFWRHCAAHLPKLSVFDIYAFRNKWECYNSGIITFDDVKNSGISLTHMQELQLRYASGVEDTFIDRERIRKFLSELWMPLYFLDFETMQLAVPRFDGTSPYQQIPFQYSLHFIEQVGDKPCHAEFLAPPVGDPRRAVAERLCSDIPENACVLAYNKSVESGHIAKLAELFPDLGDKLTRIKEHIADMITPFKSGMYYKRAMGNSFSVKSVLPALFEGDPTADYHNLDGVQNGVEAMSVYPKMRDMSPDELERVRRELLEYCSLDTFAMVRIYNELLRVSG